MRHGTAIEWTHLPGYRGETWNPWSGCLKVSAGCENCYAIRQANRFCYVWIKKNRLPQYVGTVKNGNWTGRVNRAPISAFHRPAHWRDPRAIFTCSMSDFFHPGADEWREHAWHTIYDTPQHLYLILTKRPERIPDCLPSFGKKEWPWPHVWLGATVENQEMAKKRIPELVTAPAAKRFLSLEPLLGPIDLSPWFPIIDDDGHCTVCGIREEEGVSHTEDGCPPGFHRISWVIAGGESGPNARPMHPGWVRSIRDQCQEAWVPFFLKQHGEWSWVYGGEPRNAKSMIIGGENNAEKVWRIGKKRAGRLLDGRTWEEFPL